MPIRFKDAGDRLADFKLKSRKKINYINKNM